MERRFKQNYKLPGREVTGQRVMETLFALTHRELKYDEVARFISSSGAYALACLSILGELKLVIKAPSGFRVAPEVVQDLRTMKLADRHIILGKYLVRYKPFVEFLAMIHKRYRVREAASKVNVLYDLKTGDPYVERIFLSLGLYSKLLHKSGDSIMIAATVEDLPTGYIDRLREAMLSEFNARLFVSERLGDDAYQYLGDPQVEEFVHGLLEFREDPKDSIVCVGRAIEDFLRTLGATKGKKDYGVPNGIVQIAETMRGEDPPLLLHGHLARTDFSGKLRNPAGGHGKDKETFERWNVSPEAALEAILVGLSCVRSIYAYAFRGHQLL